VTLYTVQLDEKSKYASLAKEQAFGPQTYLDSLLKLAKGATKAVHLLLLEKSVINVI
jgi:hypothetical protein